MGWGHNRWLSTRSRDGSRGTSIASESTDALMSLMRHMRKYKCIVAFNEAYTGSVLTSWLRHIQKTLLGLQKHCQMHSSMEWPESWKYLCKCYVSKCCLRCFWKYIFNCSSIKIDNRWVLLFSYTFNPWSAAYPLRNCGKQQRCIDTRVWNHFSINA